MTNWPGTLRAEMGSNVLPFAVRSAVPLPARTPVAWLVAVTRTATLAITISPLRRSARDPRPAPLDFSPSRD